MAHKLARTATVLASAGAIGLLACGCGSSSVGALPVLKITERDFSIQAPRVVPAGEFRVVVRNAGPIAHELLIVRANSTQLPLRSDGFTIDEDALEKRLVGVVEPEAAGTERDLVVRLKPGRYVVLCNMAGHAAGGMQRILRVR
jgi:hypothetical protein